MRENNSIESVSLTLKSRAIGVVSNIIVVNCRRNTSRALAKLDFEYLFEVRVTPVRVKNSGNFRVHYMRLDEGKVEAFWEKNSLFSE